MSGLEESLRGHASPGVARPRAAWPDVHFVIAAVILAVTAMGVFAARQWGGVVVQKEPVPWPQGVQVAAEHRLISFPDTLGPFRLLQSDDPIFLNAKPQTPRGGDVEFSKDDTDTLGIGTRFDHGRYNDRCSNWFLARRYRDSRTASRHALWQLNVFYYTGGLDTVPHIPEVCMQAGGADLQGSQRVEFLVPDGRAPWQGQIPLMRVQYQQGGRDRQTRVDYYTFSLNGRPEVSREAVRLSIANIFKRHYYFAKIEFSPLDPVEDMAEADQAAQDFFRHALPEVLKVLPTLNDVDDADKRK